MDSPKKSWYLLCDVQRKERRPQKIRSAAGHSRFDDFENTPGHGSIARIRNRPTPRATERGRAEAERRHGVHLIDAVAAGGMDYCEVGRLREQPEGEILFDHEAWPESARERDGGLAAYLRRHCPRPACGGTEVVIGRWLATAWERLRRTIRDEPRDVEFQAEMDEHVRLLAERYRRQGIAEEAAMLAARRQFG